MHARIRWQIGSVELNLKVEYKFAIQISVR